MSAKRGGRRHRQQQSSAEAPVIRPWLWFRLEPGGRSPAEEEFLRLPSVGRAGLAAAILRCRRGETRPGDVKPVSDGILEIRDRVDTLRFRVLFIQWGRYCVGLTAFCKKEPKTPKPELDTARQRAKRWRTLNGNEPKE
jgi:phage-related protein